MPVLAQDGAAAGLRVPGASFAAIDPALPRRVAEDFELGPLYDPLAAGSAERAVAERVRALFDALAAGRVPSDLLEPGRSLLVGRHLEEAVSAERLPTGMVLGSVRIGDDASAEVPVRLTSVVGRTTGEIYLIRIDNRWYISDVHLDFRLLSHPEESLDRRYEPTSYEWTIRRP